MAPVALPPPPVAIYSFVQDEPKRKLGTHKVCSYINTQIKYNNPLEIKNNNTVSIDMNVVEPLINKYVEDMAKLYEEKDLNSEHITNSIKAFVLSTIRLSSLKFEKIGVEANKESIYFFAKKDGFNIHYEVFTKHNIEEEAYEVVVNVFKQRKQQLSINGGEDFVIKKLESLFELDSICVVA